MMSYLWINDFIAILERFLWLSCTEDELEPYYNVTPDTPIRLSEFGHKITTQLSGSEIVVASRETAPAYTGSNTKLKNRFKEYGLAWPSTPIEDTIRIMADAFKEEHQ
jgi:hypothetical protein